MLRMQQHAVYDDTPSEEGRKRTLAGSLQFQHLSATDRGAAVALRWRHWIDLHRRASNHRVGQHVLVTESDAGAREFRGLVLAPVLPLALQATDGSDRHLVRAGDRA